MRDVVLDLHDLRDEILFIAVAISVLMQPEGHGQPEQPRAVA